MIDDAKALGAIAATASATVPGSITVATVTTSAPGIMGVLGFTTTTVVALPVAGIVTVGGLLCYGAYKTHQHLTKH